MNEYDLWASDAYGGDEPISFDYPVDSFDFGTGALDDATLSQLINNGLNISGLDLSNVSDADVVDLFSTTDTPDDVAAALRLPMNADGTYSPARDSQYANQLIEAKAPGFEQFGGNALAGYQDPRSTPSKVRIGDKTYSATGKPTSTPNKPHSGTNKIGGEGGNDLLKLLLPILLMMAMRDKGGGGASAVIPALTATQKQTPYSQIQKAPGYRPGQGGITYFEPTQYTPRMAGGGIIDLARALAAKRREQRLGLLKGRGDGTSDSIPAMIGRDQPARLARGEYVVDARTVAELGNGSTDAGAERLDEMRKRVHSKRKKAKVGQDTKAYKALPA